MLRVSLRLIILALALSLISSASAAPAHKPPAHKKQRVSRHWHGYGFLPGYRPPEVIERERAEHYYEMMNGPVYYGPAWPGFYNNRWNGGGFGPCYTQTPIGPIWNCGR
ncbi:MAG: hypothetical protein WAK63_13740 [Xanthobacteraceae bacterium]